MTDRMTAQGWARAGSLVLALGLLWAGKATAAERFAPAIPRPLPASASRPVASAAAAPARLEAAHQETRYTTEMRQVERVVYQPVQRMVWKQRWHGRWNPLIPNHASYYLAPETVWVAQRKTVTIPFTHARRIDTSPSATVLAARTGMPTVPLAERPASPGTDSLAERSPEFTSRDSNWSAADPNSVGRLDAFTAAASSWQPRGGQWLAVDAPTTDPPFSPSQSRIALHPDAVESSPARR